MTLLFCVLRASQVHHIPAPAVVTLTQFAASSIVVVRSPSPDIGRGSHSSCKSVCWPAHDTHSAICVCVAACVASPGVERRVLAGLGVAYLSIRCSGAGSVISCSTSSPSLRVTHCHTSYCPASTGCCTSAFAIATKNFEHEPRKPACLHVRPGTYSNMRVLASANVETVIVFRSCAPLCVSMLDYVFYGRELPSRRSAAAMLLIVAGATVCRRREKSPHAHCKC